MKKYCLFFSLIFLHTLLFANSNLTIIKVDEIKKATYNDIKITGDYAYAATSKGLKIFDINSPENSTLTGSYDTKHYLWGVDVVGNYAYAAGSSYGLEIIDVTDPKNPQLAGSYNTDGSARGIAVEGDFAYVADYSGGLKIINISDPYNPKLSGNINTMSDAHGVSVKNGTAYVADDQAGLQIIDIKDPHNPKLIKNHKTNNVVYSVKTDDSDYAYIADFAGGSQILNISNPQSPTLISTIPSSNYTYNIAISENYLIMADFASGIQVVDVSNPATPTVLGAYDTTGYAQAIDTYKNYIFVADGGSGLKILKMFDSEKIKSFVSRLYKNILDRDADDGGLNFWKDQLTLSDKTATWVAEGFFKSEEFINSGLSNVEYVKRAYSTLLNREPDAGGLQYWVEQIEKHGRSREYIFYGFALSEEFAYLCQKFGITSCDFSDKEKASKTL